MSESLEIPGSFYAFHSDASLDVGGFEPHAEVFQNPLCAPVVPVPAQSKDALAFPNAFLKIPDFSFFSQPQAQPKCV